MAGTDEMLEHTQGVVMQILNGEATAQPESICVPLQTDDKPMVIAALLVRPLINASGEVDGALVLEAGTDYHCVSLDGEDKELELRLDSLNHAPLALPASFFNEALKRYLHLIRVEHSYVTDPVSGHRMDVCDHLIPIAMDEVSASLQGAGPTPTPADASWSRKLVDCQGVTDVLTLRQRLGKGYASNVQLEDETRRVELAVLLTAGAAAGKSVIVSQLAHAAARDFESAEGGLLPVVIKVSSLGARCRSRAPDSGGPHPL